ncbi:hypothetical protein NE237_001158 [Protea cynaroides]|uniref:Apple domain-containing protein n=1 Tax=Protea cynaroides TaxID=273540 RepID=A0A9Q0KSS8_9MAGN|nr:hypothetical protein NE237_001158 [Protea cynaroides]
MTQSYVYSYAFVNTTDELYGVYNIFNSSIFSPFVLDDPGAIQHMMWGESNRRWNTFYSAPTDWCDYYGQCGAYSSCHTENTVKCVCLKLPNTSMSLVDKNLSLKECELGCLSNCSCTAYAPADITGDGSGCVTWFGNLMDIRYFSYGGDDLHLRVDAVELAAQARKDKGFFYNKRKVETLTVSLVMGLLLFAASAYRLLKKRKGK